MTETTAPAVEEEERLVLDLRQRSRLVITQQVFGLEPYVILRPTVDEGTGVFLVGIEAGGGADLANVGAFLGGIAEALLDEGTQQGIAAAVLASEAQEESE